ncbi:MAG: calcium/sodium antiporter [Clostridia bacterium]|nr:calcium/sodium antiporter [Clostridia bacterium]
MPLQAILLFALALVLLIKGGDWFVQGSVGIAHRLGVPELLIGATVVSIGTTLPEVMVSATSAAGGHSQISYGNAIGSVICNTALISAITLAVRPGKTDRKTLFIPVVFFFSAALFYAANAYFFGFFHRAAGIIMLLIFAAYIFLSVRSAKNGTLEPQSDEEGEEETKTGGLFSDIVWLIIGAALIAVGAQLLVDNGTVIAAWLGVPESVIGLTFVALGTSLPELVTAIVALSKGHGALSLGNIIGANLFNIVLVSGLATVISPFAVPQGSTVSGYPASLLVEIPLMLFVMLLLTVPALIKGKLYRWQGITLLSLYAAFCAFQFMI